MLAAQVHLALNHSPVFATIVGLGFLGVALVTKREALEKLALGFFVGGALLSLPVYFSGEPTEEIVEHLPEVSHGLIHRHEEAAQLAFVGLLILGALALVLLVLRARGRALPKAAPLLTALVALAVAALAARAAHFGGEIRHGEIRLDAAEAIDATGIDSRTDAHGTVDPD